VTNINKEKERLGSLERRDSVLGLEIKECSGDDFVAFLWAF